MLRFDPVPALRPLATLAAALVLTTVAGAQTYTAKSGSSIGGTGDQHIASVPTVSFWDGTWQHSTRHAWSRAQRGALECTALCTTDAQYNMAAYGIAEFKYDDLVFTSTGSAPIQVGLHLTIEGNTSVINGNGFFVELKHGGTHVIGRATYTAAGMGSATGDLTGWNMTSIFSFEHSMTVPVNTPVSLRISMAASASAVAGGHQANGHYTLRLGGASPLPSPGARYEVFDLPPGVTVDSATAGISNNIWATPERLHLFADRAVVAPGESLRLAAWNGVPGELVGLSIGWGPVPAAPAIGPSAWSGYTASLDGDGWWWAAPVPYSPALAGSTMLVRAHSFDPFNQRIRSNEVAIQFQ